LLSTLLTALQKSKQFQAIKKVNIVKKLTFKWMGVLAFESKSNWWEAPT